MLSAPPEGQARRCGVLGLPVRHSLSPTLHRAAYRVLGLDDWRYDAFEVNEAELPRFVATRDASWRGLSLTMPLKRAALALGRPDTMAARSGAANTLLLAPGGGEHRLFNTDVPGLAAAVRARLGEGEPPLRTAVVLGTGATARSAVVALPLLGVTAVTVLGRAPAKVEGLVALARDLGLAATPLPFVASAVPECDLAVSTVVAHAADRLAVAVSRRSRVVFDVLYDPWPTLLAAAATAAGCVVVDGLDLLVHQAAAQIELMTGRSVDAAVLLSAGQEELSRRGGR